MLPNPKNKVQMECWGKEGKKGSSLSFLTGPILQATWNDLDRDLNAWRGDDPSPAGVAKNNCGRGYFFAFLSARFSFMDLAGFFLVSFFESWLFPMAAPCACVG